jgi:hypothetical protein
MFGLSLFDYRKILYAKYRHALIIDSGSFA